jgi:ribonuclease BN (tRNA processing enzyme)
MTRLIFLGTGGGRFATIYQMRATAGIYLDDGVRMHIDPGPGALVHMHRAGIDPTQTDAILISHCHPDHYTDAEILIEAMTMGGTKKRGTIIGSKSVFEGVKDFSPAISSYHSKLVEHTISMVPKMRVKVGHVAIEATPSAHPTSSPSVSGSSPVTASYLMSATRPSRPRSWPRTGWPGSSS